MYTNNIKVKDLMGDKFIPRRYYIYRRKHQQMNFRVIILVVVVVVDAVADFILSQHR